MMEFPRLRPNETSSIARHRRSSVRIAWKILATQMGTTAFRICSASWFRSRKGAPCRKKWAKREASMRQPFWKSNCKERTNQWSPCWSASTRLKISLMNTICRPEMQRKSLRNRRKSTMKPKIRSNNTRSTSVVLSSGNSFLRKKSPVCRFWT